ncbi:nitrogen fixation protein FixH [Pseudoxanthomonas sp. Root65]|uniref:FixH family protein n=1 Tax=Pseudoxanthomonas sp. Root65 TaxID=1736576 RepID=UPI0006F97553|nr:FixH family protein [Pseudoxanthomonas sp. Root65]KRA54464.1 nitrogen fixation protein FixH [Pseudoxanthomonas sp. Root65]
MTTKPDASAANARPFWKEPMVWLVWGLPLASVVAGLWLVVTAVRAGGADPVIDEVQRVSQIQTTDLGPDERAAQRKLSAILQVRPDHVELTAVTGEFGRETSLVLVLTHPTEAAQDLRLPLSRTTTGWTAPAEIDTRHDWNLQLTPANSAWRIRGRLQKETQASRLAPSLGGG